LGLFDTFGRKEDRESKEKILKNTWTDEYATARILNRVVVEYPEEV